MRQSVRRAAAVLVHVRGERRLELLPLRQARRRTKRQVLAPLRRRNPRPRPRQPPLLTRRLAFVGPDTLDNSSGKPIYYGLENGGKGDG